MGQGGRDFSFQSYVSFIAVSDFLFLLIFSNFILLRVVMFESLRLEGLLNQFLAGPPIPFESGVDFWLNCPVCLVKVTVFNLCHLIPSVTPNSAAEGYQLSALLVWWPTAGFWKTRKRLQRGLNLASLCWNCVAEMKFSDFVMVAERFLFIYL